METAAHSVYSMHMLCHGGWSSEEDKLLFEEVKKAREAGRSLKSAFDRMESLTGGLPERCKLAFRIESKSGIRNYRKHCHLSIFHTEHIGKRKCGSRQADHSGLRSEKYLSGRPEMGDHRTAQYRLRPRSVPRQAENHCRLLLQEDLRSSQ